MKVRDIMTKDVAYLDSSSTVAEAAQLMQRLNVGAIPVCDRNGVVGMVTDRDIVIRNVAAGSDPSKIAITDIMTTNVATVSPDTDISKLTGIMSRHQIRRVPVVENNSLVGIVSLGDLATDSRFDTEAAEALADISMPSRPAKQGGGIQPSNR